MINTDIVSYLKKLYKISRPRFWVYTAGPYLIGYILSVSALGDFLKPSFWLHFAFFLIPANILIYGVNDLFDADTDNLNDKKGTKEYLFSQKDTWPVVATLFCIFVAALLLVLFQSTLLSGSLLLLFLFLSLGYSMPPFRFKSKPVIDSVSNVLYAIPGLLAFTQLTGNLPPFYIIIAVLCWTAAMHLFSAIPDIEPDSQAKLLTTAVAFGRTQSLALCAFLWSVFSITLLLEPRLFPFSFLSFVYPLLCFILMLRPTKTNITRIYWLFPYINFAMGIGFWWFVALTRFVF